MEDLRSGPVDIVREFLVAHHIMSGVFDGFRAGSLRFQDVAAVTAGDDESVLFRLKGECHAFAAAAARSASHLLRRAALLDVAVGSLYHEAMKFRENLYQQEIYAPKVRELRSESRESGEEAEEADELFREFEKMLANSAERLVESAQETEVLLHRVRGQVRRLLAACDDDGLLARFLIEKRVLVEEVFPTGLDALLAEMHGGTVEGYMAATHSYLASSFFDEALGALAEAGTRSSAKAEISRLGAFAKGMQAFIAGRYAASLTHLGEWIDADPPKAEAAYASLAHAALSRIHNLVRDSEGRILVATATALTRRIESLSSGPAA